MKKLFFGSSLFVALTLIFAISNLRAEENVLINPGFENDIKGWTGWSSHEGAANGGISTERYHGGSYSAKRWLVYPKDLTYSCFIQELDVKVEEGDAISFGGWMMSPPNEPLSGGAEAFLVIEFWQSAKKLAYPESKRLNSQSQWKEFEVSGIAPKGTDLVKVCLFLFGFEGSKGAVYFDDLKVTIKPKRTPH